MEMFDDMMEQAKPNMDIAGINLGLVKENWNKDYPGMIKVELVMDEAKNNVTGWLPVMTPYGGNEFGFYALPEIGTQVVVAYHGGDGDCPVVLGSLWNQKIKLPAEMAEEKNLKKCLITKGGHKIIFVEEEKKQSICIETPGKLTVKLEDEKKTITIQDEKGENCLTLNGESGEISIQAKKKISFQVDGKEMITMDGEAEEVKLAGNQIKGEAKQALEWKGQTVAIKGTSVEIKGDSTLKAESGGMTQVKGAMVNIN